MLLTGTDPALPSGGIGVAMAGYRDALAGAGLLDSLIPSYRPRGIRGRAYLAVRAAATLVRRVRSIRRGGGAPVVYAHGGGPLGILRQSLLLCFARAAGARTMLQLHSLSVDRYLQSPPGRSFLRLCTLPAGRICVPTPWWRDRIATSLPGAHIELIPNPLPPEVEEAARAGVGRRRPAKAAQGIHLLCMTRLVAGKGVDVLLEALSFLPAHVRVSVAGDGPERIALERLARALGVADRVEFTGWVRGRDKRRLLEACDVFCLPTRRDSFGMGLIEAMAHGCPVVAAKWGPIADVVPDGEVGVLAEGQDARAVAEAIERVSDGEVLPELGVRARRWVLERFSAEAVGRELAKTLTDPVV